MRAVVQRVSRARVTVDGEVTGAIERGLCVLLGAGDQDTEADVEYMADKIVNLRIFEDDAGKMNRSLLDVAGELLAVSQFTLYGDARKGRRPAFVHAMEPGEAQRLYELFVDRVRASGVSNVGTGVFRATMEVEIVNSGPVTILIDSKKEF